GSLRRAGAAVQNFAPDEVSFTAGRVWESASSRARYPVEWTVATPVGRFTVAALLDDQELDSRGSTGAIYWEGLSDLRDAAGRTIGRGYLEMTGYAAALRL
ncbi:MAG TPA: lipocalin family protein, partial [Burkholderiaceae bacterium]